MHGALRPDPSPHPQALPYVALLIVMLFFIYAVIGMQVRAGGPCSKWGSGPRGGGGHLWTLEGGRISTESGPSTLPASSVPATMGSDAGPRKDAGHLTPGGCRTGRLGAIQEEPWHMGGQQGSPEEGIRCLSLPPCKPCPPIPHMESLSWLVLGKRGPLSRFPLAPWEELLPILKII